MVKEYYGKGFFNLSLGCKLKLNFCADHGMLVSNVDVSALSSSDFESAAMRRFIRHPSDVPIKFSQNIPLSKSDRLKNISHGGLCFVSKTPLKMGSNIHIEIDIKACPFSADGTVAWCQKEESGYAVGVSFADHSTQYSVRMIEQICYIEHYRSQMLQTHGRKLTSDEAAREWIAKYAAKFPNCD